MRSVWKRLAVFIVAVAVLLVLVLVATRNENRTTGLIAMQALFIAVVSYLITFAVWPRKPQNSGAAVAPGPRPKRPVSEDQRPVVVIGDRPAGSPPGSSIHEREAMGARAARGRRPGERTQAEMRWPANR